MNPIYAFFDVKIDFLPIGKIQAKGENEFRRSKVTDHLLVQQLKASIDRSTLQVYYQGILAETESEFGNGS